MTEEGILDDIKPSRSIEEAHDALPRLKKKNIAKARKEHKRELTIADEVDEPDEDAQEIWQNITQSFKEKLIELFKEAYIWLKKNFWR